MIRGILSLTAHTCSDRNCRALPPSKSASESCAHHESVGNQPLHRLGITPNESTLPLNGDLMFQRTKVLNCLAVGVFVFAAADLQAAPLTGTYTTGGTTTPVAGTGPFTMTSTDSTFGVLRFVL